MDSEMLRQFYGRYASEIYLYLYSLCKSRELAEDLMQDVFLKALLSLSDSHTNIRAWLYKVARNTCLNELRKRNRETELDEQLAVSDKTILGNVIQNEQKKQLYQAMMKLPDRQREILELFYFSEMSIKEIAAVLSLTPENVRVLAYGAKSSCEMRWRAMDMSYREKIERYKKHQLTEEETKEVEAEIEKTEAISDYLADRLMDDLEEEFFSKDSGEQTDAKEKMEQNTASAKEFEAYVKKSIHRSFRRMGMAVGGVVLAVVLFIQFGMSPLMSSLYYNPAKTEILETKSGDITYQTSYSQIEVDFHVYAELSLPCKVCDNVQALSNGYGNYQILISPVISFGTKRGTTTAGQIRKGKLELYNPDYLQGGPANYFVGYGLDRDRDFVSQMKEKCALKKDGELTIYNEWF